MKRALGFLAVLSCSCELVAVTVDSSWKIAVPAWDETGVAAAIHESARELSAALKESVGLDVPVVSAAKFPERAHAIRLGLAAAQSAGLCAEPPKGMENVIAEKNGDLYLFGTDRPGRRDQRNLPYWKCQLPTVRAVARFMEQHMNVRFLAPGRTGMDCVKLEKVVVPDGLRSCEVPRITVCYGRKTTLMNDIANGVFGSGVYHSYGGHTYDAACPPEKHYKDHPEYFGLIQGRRTITPRACVPLCVSNPAVEDLIVAEMLRQYDAGCEVCQLGQQDGWRACQCERCRTFMDVTPEDDWCEKLWRFHVKIAKRIERLRPGKIVHILCYGPTAVHPPRAFRTFPSNVMVEMCGPSEKMFADWADYEVPHGFTVYTYLWGTYPVLGFTAKHSYASCADFARMLVRNRVHGMYRCGYGEFYGMEGPAYWVFNRTLLDPEADTAKLVDEYCARMYGPAAGAMRKFHDILDARLRTVEALIAAVKKPVVRFGQVPLDIPPTDLLAMAYGGDTIKRMDSWLAYAETLAKTDKQRRRLKLVRAEFDYAKNLGRIAALYQAWQVVPTDDLRGQIGLLLRERKDIMAKILRGKSRIQPFPDWPEVTFMGGEGVTAGELLHNGSLKATIHAPLTWDPNALPSAVAPVTAERRSMTAIRVAKAPDWDGLKALPASAWQKLGGGQMEKIRTNTRICCAYDGEALYLAAETDLDDAVKVADFVPDGPVWRDEEMELIVDSSGSRLKYCHLIWGPEKGSRYDEAFGFITDPLHPGYGKADSSWNGDWTVSNVRGGNTWRSIVRIPYGTLGTSEPKPGDQWALNVSRSRLGADRNADNAELSLWSPNMESRGILNADAMGTLTFK